MNLGRTPRLLALSLFVAGCGKEQGRVHFSGEGSNSAAMVLNAGRVAFWSDITVGYTGSARLEYHIALLQGGSAVATAVCNPLDGLNVQMRWVQIDSGNAHSRSGNGKMDCRALLPKGGSTTVQATLAFAVRPLTASITKADLVVKQ